VHQYARFYGIVTPAQAETGGFGMFWDLPELTQNRLFLV
jgi:hypothetical protein